MPWLTPDSIPEDDDCRPLSIPADSYWLSLVSGALSELTQPYNWEKFGTLTVDETVSKFREILANYYNDPCGGCTLPEGGRIIRIGAHGHLEELGDDSTWGEPTGDYVIPPPDARTGGTAPDQNCLAAKNAVNVLQQLYENLSESWASHLSEAEAGTEFIIAAGAIIGFEFAPITLAIVAFLEVVFAALYTALEYLGADLWDEAFTKQLECFLLECASNDAGVVTFDWDCLLARLNSLTDSFGLSEVQLRLYLQVTYILYFIGGVDGLNLAARTTEITNDDCLFCEAWCYTWDFTDNDGGWNPTVISGLDFATWSSGNGWGARIQTDGCANHAYWYFNLSLGGSFTSILSVEIEFATAVGSFNSRVLQQQLSGSGVNNATFDDGVDTVHTAFLAPTATDALFMIVNKCGMTQDYIVRMTIRGEGDMPTFTGGMDCP